jgi:exodeoxyribonuclease VII large subunit
MDDLFDFGDPEPAKDDKADPRDEVFSVSALTRKIRNLLELRIGEVWVEGEISNLRKQASGHQYFTLKDESAQISCVMFRGNARNLAAPIEDGQKVQLQGEVSVYEPRGTYQIIVRLVQDKGLGALQAKFENLKQRLSAEGLFDQDKKKQIPKFPRRLCLVTSPSGAALQDMLNILGRRAPWVEVSIYPVRVQGTAAAGEIVAALKHIGSGDGSLPKFDTVVVSRGGGSLEDLWPFNEESVARAIHALDIPVVSAVGHEIDFTIADFSADLRAPTPSAAAELIVPDAGELRTRLDSLGRGMKKHTTEVVERWSERLDYLQRGALTREPTRALADLEQQLDWKADTLTTSASTALSEAESILTEFRHRIALSHPIQRLDGAIADFDLIRNRLASSTESALHYISERCSNAGAALKNLGPDAVLSRGYSVTLDTEGKPISSPSEVNPGQTIRTHVSEGDFESTVK